MNQRVVVGITGGIAAYKSAALVSCLAQRGFDVFVVLTESAQQFVGAATFAALCNRAPITNAFDPRFPLGPHIELAMDCKLFVVAPATAHVIASCALGLADCLLSTLYLNIECPVVFAPAMSTPMWEKPPVIRNMDHTTSSSAWYIVACPSWMRGVWSLGATMQWSTPGERSILPPS